VKIKIVIGGVLLLAVGLAGGMYYRCFQQTVCVINSKVRSGDKVYKIDRKMVREFVIQVQPERNLKTVWLWQKADQPGFHRREKAGNKPVWVEIRAGAEGKALSKKGADEVRIIVLGENHGLYHKLILSVNPQYEDIYDPEIGGAFVRSLRWHVGSKDWPNEELTGLMRRI
jgi:hypothetical protein